MREWMSVNEKSFEVIKLLGKGKGGYSYLVKDKDRQYVLKHTMHRVLSWQKRKRYFRKNSPRDMQLNWGRPVELGHTRCLSSNAPFVRVSLLVEGNRNCTLLNTL